MLVKDASCPLIYSIYINMCTEFKFRETPDFEGVKLNNLNVNNARYADDTALFANAKKGYKIL